MRIALLALFTVSLLSAADVPPAEIRAPKPEAWVGQRLPFFVDLRSKGSFSGTSAFDLPQIPGALVVKIGDPVVDTQKFEGEEWFIQRHEFALFSQKSGAVEIPAFAVRFSRRDGFSGPVSEINARTSSLKLKIERPPNSGKIGFLITTEDLELTESWEPKPGPAKVGDVFKRTIKQRAEQLPGMALAPTPANSPDGIRIYPGQADSKDNFYRGAFVGERSETTTYLLQEPGSLTLPGLTYTWWNPKTKELQSKTLPAVTFEVTAPPVSAAGEKAATARSFWPWFLVAALAIGGTIWQRKRLAVWAHQFWNRLNPPDRIAARKLRHACRDNDPKAAESAWSTWRNFQGSEFQPDEELHTAVLELERVLFHPDSDGSWKGDTLARAFAKSSASVKGHAGCKSESSLPLLNPRPKSH